MNIKHQLLTYLYLLIILFLSRTEGLGCMPGFAESVILWNSTELRIVGKCFYDTLSDKLGLDVHEQWFVVCNF